MSDENEYVERVKGFVQWAFNMGAMRVKFDAIEVTFAPPQQAAPPPATELTPEDKARMRNETMYWSSEGTT